MSEHCNISPRFSLKFLSRCNILRTFGFYNTLINKGKEATQWNWLRHWFWIWRCWSSRPLPLCWCSGNGWPGTSASRLPWLLSVMFSCFGMNCSTMRASACSRCWFWYSWRPPAQQRSAFTTNKEKVEQKIGIINRKYHRRYNLWKKKQWEL